MSNYFRNLPDFDYVSRLPGAKISDYNKVKNFFKEDLFERIYSKSYLSSPSIKSKEMIDQIMLLGIFIKNLD